MTRRAPAVAAAAILACLTACGGSSSTTPEDTGGSSGTQAGTPNRSGSSGTTGTGAQGGTADVGGTSGSGGATGGAAGETGGAAGAPPTGVGAVAEIDSACDTPGALACAGNHQRVALICQGGTWQRNEACPENHACDTTPGFDQGTCKERLAECAGVEPGHRFCDPGATAVMACGPDNVTLERVEECTGVCIDAACDNRPNHCPIGDYINCGSECREPDEGCSTSCTAINLSGRVSTTIRTPAYAGLCAASCVSTIRELLIVLWERPGPAKVTVPAPWRIATEFYDTGSGNVCTLDSSETCVVVETQLLRPLSVYVFTDDPAAVEENANVEVAGYDEQLECP